jgi:uridine kinase
MANVEIQCDNTGRTCEYPLGTTLAEIAKDMQIELNAPICGAFVNNRVKSLDFEVVKPKKISFFDYSCIDGRRMYLRTLSLVLYAAIRNLWPEVRLKIDHSISNGYYCEIENGEQLITNNDIWVLRDEMQNLIDKNLSIKRRRLISEKAVDIFEEDGLSRKAELYRAYGRLYAPVVCLEEHINFFYGHVLPSTGYLNRFDVEKYYDGFLLRVPMVDSPEELEPVVRQEKLFGIFREHKEWAGILRIEDIAGLNNLTNGRTIGDVIKVSEALHEKKIIEIANHIYEYRDKINIVLVAGPSSSGKTTFSKRLGVQLAVCGMRPIPISLDDFFVNREYTPVGEDGEYDFEALEAVDVEYFNSFLQKLKNGDEVERPSFDFHTGQRIFKGKKLKLGEGSILIIEGIHGLNPELLTSESYKIFRIFISALTQISIDEHNYIPTTDNRLIRRIIRDSKYRGYDATTTIKRWPDVRRGESKHIFPYQENADVMFNSALIYELGVLRKSVEVLLETVKENVPEYSEAVRLLNFISYFNTIPEEEIPPTSVLREFLGGSSFEY